MTPEKREETRGPGFYYRATAEGQREWTTNRVAVGSRQTAALSSPAGLKRADGHTQKKRAPGDLPIGMTTPNTATVRFSPRRKFSLPADERGGTEELEGESH